jgi:hypothetical protein
MYSPALLCSDRAPSACPLLCSAGIAFPELIGINWRLDYSIRSKHGGRKNTAMYFVVLKVKDRGLPREIQMMASYEDLQDMLAKVGHAPAPCFNRCIT